MKLQICYRCGAPSSSVEHVPAKCFFPEGPAFRNQLITVPSCALHNEKTSLDDEYVRNVIAMVDGTNPVAFGQFQSKVMDSFKRSPALLQRTLQNKQDVMLPTGEGLAFEVDKIRFEAVMSKIAYGLYFYKFKKPWIASELIIMTKHLRTKGLGFDDYSSVIDWADAHLPNQSFSGSNPQVFKYGIHHDEGEEFKVVIRTIYYEYFACYIIPKTGIVGKSGG